jgi:hypothetical protein
MEWLDNGPCTIGKYLTAWGLYGYAVLHLWQFVRSAGLPEVLSWIGAGLMSLVVLSWTN